MLLMLMLMLCPDMVCKLCRKQQQHETIAAWLLHMFQVLRDTVEVEVFFFRYIDDVVAIIATIVKQGRSNTNRTTNRQTFLSWNLHLTRSKIDFSCKPSKHA